MVTSSFIDVQFMQAGQNQLGLGSDFSNIILFPFFL